MQQFLAEAGVMIFLLIAAGAVALPVSVSFAYRPTPKKRRVANAFIRTLIFGALAAYSSGMVSTLRATKMTFDDPQVAWWQVFIVGTGESANNLLFGLGMVALCTLFLAVGETRDNS